ncbi:MAG: hypothetical protein KDE14_05340, partial [Rhodobacteraceae bacterium]|nr:hypothetical protein [Paracoccaceae bacterium]
MLNRRIFFGTGGTITAAVSALLSGKKAAAKDTPMDVEPRGAQGRLERLPTLDVESRVDFLTGMRRWRADVLEPAARRRFEAILKENGEDPKKDLPLERIFELVENDP